MLWTGPMKRMTWRALSIVCGMALATVGAFNDQSSLPGGRVDGVTVSAQTGQVVPGVQVMATRVPASSSMFSHKFSGFADMNGDPAGSVISGDDGRFSLRQLPQGWYEFLAFDAGQGMLYGARASMETGRMVMVGAEDAPANIRIQVWQFGTIVGHARTESGEPIAGLAVVAANADDSSPDAEGGSAMTDDEGKFLIAVRPGRYVVSTSREFWPSAVVLVTDGTGQLKSYPPTFYPNSPVRDGAVVVAVRSGQRTDGIDFRLAPQPWLTVSGQLGRTEWGTKIRVAPVGSLGAIDVKPEGSTFTLRGLLPGQYRLQIIMRPFAGRDRSFQEAVWTDEPFSLDDRDVQLTPRLREGFRLSGTVEFDGRVPTREELSKLSLELDPLDNDITLGWGTLDPDRRFSTIQLAPDNYYLTAQLPGRFLKSVTSASGRDYTGAPIPVVDRDVGDLIIRFSEQPARLQGSVARAPGRDVPRVWVAVFPFERELWPTTANRPLRFARILTGTDGTYDATLPPGRYYVIAVDRRVRWADNWASLAAQAELVDLREGTLVRDLKVTSTR